MATSIASGSKAAPVVPAAARIRPQLGSRPKTAHLNRLLLATARPTSTASSSLAAPRTVIVMSCSDPSASESSSMVRSWQTARTASANSAAAGVTPAAPEAISSTVSLVDMQPSESSRSKVVRVAARRAAAQVAASTSASVVSTTSMVARPGASIPAPLAIPATDQPPGAVRTTVLGWVSVVMIASAAAVPPSVERAATAASTPAVSFSRSSRSPISPVEQTTMSVAGQPTPAPTLAAVAAVVAYPSGPV